MRTLLNKLSGTHITILALAAVFLPGALGAAVVYQAVAIVDPNTGAKAYVDSARNLRVADVVAGYSKTPANFVNITQPMSSTNSSFAIYTPPANKALVVKSAQLVYFGNTPNNNIYAYLSDSIGHTLLNFEAIDAAGQITFNFDPGLVLHSNQQLSVRFGSTDGNQNRWGYLYLQGYLVPATAVPTVASLESQQQFVNPPPNGKQIPRQ